PSRAWPTRWKTEAIWFQVAVFSCMSSSSARRKLDQGPISLNLAGRGGMEPAAGEGAAAAGGNPGWAALPLNGAGDLMSAAGRQHADGIGVAGPFFAMGHRLDRHGRAIDRCRTPIGLAWQGDR